MYRNIDVLGHQISVSVSVLRHKTRKHSELQQANDHVYRFIVLLSQRCLYSTECFPLTSQTSYVSPSITVITPKLVLFLWFFYTGLAQSTLASYMSWKAHAHTHTHTQTTFLFHPYTHTAHWTHSLVVRRSRGHVIVRAGLSVAACCLALLMMQQSKGECHVTKIIDHY